jgi:hypothetical protein
MHRATVGGLPVEYCVDRQSDCLEAVEILALLGRDDQTASCAIDFVGCIFQGFRIVADNDDGIPTANLLEPTWKALA